jgi:acetylglutamate kinase
MVNKEYFGSQANFIGEQGGKSYSSVGASREKSLSGGTVVIKLGGSTLGSHDTIVEDIVNIQGEGHSPVVVHGGGKIITEWMNRQGVRPKFVKGLRVTDKGSLDIVVSVLGGLINKQIVADINAMGGNAVGISGVDGRILEAEINEPELGLVGSIVKVNPQTIVDLVTAGYVPVIAPIGLNVSKEKPDNIQLLNINADTAAGEIAVALKSEALLFSTDVDGVVDSSHRVISVLTERHARSLIGSSVIAGGMLPKVGACLRAQREVGFSHILDGRKPHAVIEALRGAKIGTRFV